MNEFVEHLRAEFADKEYAHAYMEEHGNMILAGQIRAIREQRGLTQAQLADLAGMRQERISALENVEYGSWTVSTLRKLAKALDISLRVSFVPFSTAIMDVVNVSPERLKVPPRTEDLKSFRKHKIIKSRDRWQAIDGSKVAEVVMLEVSSAPITPRSHWQGLRRNDGQR